MTADLIAQGYAARRENRLPEARALFTEAFAHARSGGDPTLLAQSLTGLGQIDRDLHDRESARQRYEEAVALYRTLDDPLTLAHTLRHLADILQDQHHFALAEPHYAEALTLYRRHPASPPLDLANTLRPYALLKSRTGDTPAAIALFREAKALYASLGLEVGVDECQAHLTRLTDPEETPAPLL